MRAEALLLPAKPERLSPVSGTLSTSVFQSPQSPHWPAHFE